MEDVLADGLGSLFCRSLCIGLECVPVTIPQRSKTIPQRPLCGMTIASHYNRGFKAELTLNAVIGTVIKECFPRLTSS
ncbi:hypothetical protein LXL04_033646 [Taraxacum kok-saghyz]